MKQSLDFLVQTPLDIELRANQETIEDYQATVLHAEYADEFVASAILADIVTWAQRHEADLKDAFD
jgi:bacterioferritin